METTTYFQENRHTVHVERNNEARSRNHCCCGKAISITRSECVFEALTIQHPKRMRRIILSSVTCLVPPYFSLISEPARFSEEKVIEHKM